MGKVVWLYEILVLLILVSFHFQVDFSLSFSSSINSTHLCLPEERAALLQFKNTISPPNYPCPIFARKTNSWRESTDCCSWEGVACHKVTGHVIGIDLSENCLYGTLPANSSLFHLQKLQWLDLSFNSFHGCLTPNSSLFLLQGLQRLNLSWNDFNCSILSAFNQLVSLTHLNLHSSGFYGLIPSEISFLPKLVLLDLSGNGALRFDNHNFNMLASNSTSLRNLFLDNVNMYSVAPTSLLNLTSSLNSLSLASCGIAGEIPSEIFRLPYLIYLDLNENYGVTGSLPTSNWSSPLSLLDLNNCHFKESLPAALGNLTQITSLDLSGNSFRGQIPDVFENLNKLTTLEFDGCNFSGQLPVTMLNLTELVHLGMSNNRLEGPLPHHINGLQNLKELFLNGNRISGGLPSWLFTLPSLQNLELGNNKLTGPIDDQIQFPNAVLQRIVLENNEIHGPLPSFFFELENLTDLVLSSNNFSGSVKSNMLSKLQKLRGLYLSNNRFLSLSSSSNDVNYTFSKLSSLVFSSCNVRQFPNFLRTAKSLYTLDLSYNKIQGAISQWEAEGWEQLSTLDLSYNFLTSLSQFPGKNLKTVDLSSNLLQGPLPVPPPLVDLLLIPNNKFTGNIPFLICNLSLLHVLDLSNNNLGGIIPECLGNLNRSLMFLKLQMNNFYGKIPDSLGTYMVKSLDLNDNLLEGLLPRSFENCSSLEILNVANNNLLDTFPHWLGHLPLLKVLILRFNRFHGPIHNSTAPSSFPKLQIIDVSHNELTGFLPTNFFQNLRGMIDVPQFGISSPHQFWMRLRDNQGGYLTYNYQDSVNVTSKRTEIELMKLLNIFTAMDFSDNLFHGHIPEELGELCSLQVLNLSHNSLTGPIPPSFGNLVALESLDLSSNNLGGEIPSQLTNLTFLAVLNLSQNNLVGPIPHGKQFDTFENDSYGGNLGLCGFPLSKKCGNNLQLSSTSFTEDDDSEIAFIWKLAMMGYGCGLVLGLSIGYIVFATLKPWWLIGITCGSRHQRVTALNLFGMNLSGTIPPHLGNLSFLAWLNLGNNSFHGSLPIELVNLRRLKSIKLSNNNLQFQRGNPILVWFLRRTSEHVFEW
ncbi:hypothetical protein CRYUN_Cryun38cG0038400 [Craigia yunnanensis]